MNKPILINSVKDIPKLKWNKLTPTNKPEYNKPVFVLNKSKHLNCYYIDKVFLKETKESSSGTIYIWDNNPLQNIVDYWCYVPYVFHTLNK